MTVPREELLVPISSYNVYRNVNVASRRLATTIRSYYVGGSALTKRVRIV